MTDNMSNFVKWFKNPLASLYTNQDAGFIILMATFPLLERYLRQKSGLHEVVSLNDDFYNEFIGIFPYVTNIDNAKKIWGLYRHGLLHQATLKTKTKTGGTMILEIGVHGDAHEIEIGYSPAGMTVKISPKKFSEKVISTIENDFATFESPDSPSHPLPTVDEGTGTSGWGKK